MHSHQPSQPCMRSQSHNYIHIHILIHVKSIEHINFAMYMYCRASLSYVIIATSYIFQILDYRSGGLECFLTYPAK